MDKKVVELFAGVGGFRVGLNNIKGFDPISGRAIENIKWDFVWANQWEPSTKVQHAFDCYAMRFGNNEISNTDISKVIKSEIPDHSLLVGGFPCQDYSVARSKSNEKGIEGVKGVLFWEIVETLREKNTPFFLLENVDRLLKSPASQRGRDFGIMLRSLSDLGYDLEWRVINAAEYGRAQRRRRVFIFGWKRQSNYSGYIKKENMENLLMKSGVFARSFPVESIDRENEILDINLMGDTVEMTEKFAYGFLNAGIMKDGMVLTQQVSALKEKSTALREILVSDRSVSDFLVPQEKIEKFKDLRGGKRIKRIKPNGEIYFYSEGSMSDYDSLDLPARTMLTSERSINRSTHVFIDPTLNKCRFLTPIEAERLQDFPDDWTNTGMPMSRRYFMMGNALVTGIVSRIEKVIDEIISNE